MFSLVIGLKFALKIQKKRKETGKGKCTGFNIFPAENKKADFQDLPKSQL
jgi:hypothetical protein